MMSFEEYIDLIKDHLNSKYKITKMIDDKYSGLRVRFIAGYEMTLSNSRLLSYFDKIKDEQISIESSLRNITDTIEGVMSEEYMNKAKK